ncbi:MAG: alkaline phosphatase family protein, partial [Clostridia bacterium]|nr:alkaline phosphatase family protein [Clostridia bacterium]
MRKAVLVSLDAFFDADFAQLRPEGGLSRMIREGTVCRQVKTVFPALTYPAHVTIVTGCDPADTQVGQNQPFQPETPNKERVWYWERKHIAVPTLFDAVKAEGGKN